MLPLTPHPPSLPIWLIHPNFLRDSFLTKKRSISPARSKVRSRGIIDDLPGQTLSYLSPPDLSSALIHHKLKLYSGGAALTPLSAQPFVQRSSPPLHLELLEGAALKPAVQHLCCSGQMVITESICQTQAPSLVANRPLPSPLLTSLFSPFTPLFSSPLPSFSVFFPSCSPQVNVHASFTWNYQKLSKGMHCWLASVTVSNHSTRLENIYTKKHKHTHTLRGGKNNNNSTRQLPKNSQHIYINIYLYIDI